MIELNLSSIFYILSEKNYNKWLDKKTVLIKSKGRVKMSQALTKKQELILEKVRKNPYEIKKVEKENQFYELALEAVKQDGYLLSWINDELVDESLLIEAVKQNPLSIQFTAKQSERLALIAVKRNPSAYYYLEEPSEKVMLEAIKNNLSILSRVNRELLTNDLIVDLATFNPHTLNYLMDNRPELITEDLLVRLVGENWGFLIDIPKELQTTNVCLAAIANNQKALHYVEVEF